MKFIPTEKEVFAMTRFKKLSALAAALCLAVALTSCGAMQKKDAATDAEDNVSSSAVDQTAQEATPLETMVASEDFQAQVQSQSQSYEEQGIRLDITAERNTLVYTCTYTVDGAVTDEAKVNLASYLESDAMVQSIQEVLDYVKKTVPETESVRVVYRDKDGTEICSKEYR